MDEQIEQLLITGSPRNGLVAGDKCGGIGLHPSIGAIMQFFGFAHLPPDLASVSRRFAELAWLVANGPQSAETTVALRKLLEAKDCAVRAVLFEKSEG